MSRATGPASVGPAAGLSHVPAADIASSPVPAPGRGTTAGDDDLQLGLWCCYGRRFTNEAGHAGLLAERLCGAFSRVREQAHGGDASIADLPAAFPGIAQAGASIFLPKMQRARLAAALACVAFSDHFSGEVTTALCEQEVPR